ncbi:hypothetical protein [Photobacterium leiognathi]|uniref:hypothetical protein n=1 Tax=Photobacterium leiognathi TaxID=553611 RepID=UPI00273A17C8|nr:hypothetical protein [Photobacterium leiognathi]
MDSRLKCTITLLFLAGCSSGMDAVDIAKADVKAQLIREQGVDSENGKNRTLRLCQWCKPLHPPHH